MPIYEYRCNDCRKLTNVFVRSANTPPQPVCDHCQGTSLERAMSRFAYHRSEQTIIDDYGSPGLDARPEDYKDPRQIGRWVEQRFDDYGMELPPEARDMIDAAREGEFPEPVRDL